MSTDSGPLLTPPSVRPLRTRNALTRLLWRGWERVRPFPLPRYVRPTPNTSSGDPLDPFFPPTAATLGAAAMSQASADFVCAVLDRLAKNDIVDAERFFHMHGRSKYGDFWQCADLLTALRAAALLVRPRTYLEIGVWRGRSAAVVGASAPACAVYGFDLWIPQYGGANPGPEFVRSELRAAGHTGAVELVSGNSGRTVPEFLRAHPDLFFDVITIDGDKSVLGAASDLANTLPRLTVGGIVLTDDIPLRPVLRRVWNKMIRSDARYVTWDFVDAGFGVSAAIRYRE